MVPCPIIDSILNNKTHRPGDDEVVGGVASAHHVVRVLVRDVLRGEADLGVAGGQGVANLVPGDHPERVVSPGRHRDLERGGCGGNKVYKIRNY